MIDQIKALPPSEQALVVRFVQEITNGQQVRYIDEVTFKAAVDKVFKEHHELLRKLAS